MANKLYEEASIQGIANAIRAKNGSADSYAAAEMAGAISAIESGGGTELNFSVVGGTVQPASPAGNTIWVNTAAEITGWVFDKTPPAAPTEGTVWFAADINSNAAFNAVKNNGIWIYPTACQQYISGEWVPKTAMIYKSGAWVNWAYFYNQGIVNELGIGITEGYYFYPSTSVYSTGVLTANPAYLTLDTTKTASACGIGCSPTNRVDLTTYSTFNAHIHSIDSLAGTANTFRLLVGNVRSGTTTYANKVAELAYTISEASSDTTVSLDISSITGSYYTLVTLCHSSNPSGKAKVNVDKIYFA